MTIQEGLDGSPWDFSPVFAALAKPYTDPSPEITTEEHAGYFQADSRTRSSGSSRTLSYHGDDNVTPKATPADNPGSTLGDLSNALLCLGCSVEVVAPTNHDTGSLAVSTPDLSTDQKDTFSTIEDTELINRNIEDDVDTDGMEDAKLAARRAENRRRSVLNSFMAQSSDAAQNTKQKLSKQKIDDKSSQKNPAFNSKPLNGFSSRKHVNMQLATEKKVQLTLELHKRFPESQNSFYNSSNTPGSIVEPDPEGIHVFVDISNILIGFHDTLKRNRQINRNIRVPRQTLSFHNLSIILERGRLVAKRFLAGSDNIDCIQEARNLGYTTHILQRVDKLDPPIPPGTRNGNRSGLTSSDTDSGTPGRKRRAEQAVDEILHLGMLQSLLDAEKPSTIVLASGDAAKAEFSDGFLKQVERALLKGWNVEVIAFQATTGYVYRDPSWTSRWNGLFRLLPLDEFVELLHVPHEGSKF